MLQPKTFVTSFAAVQLRQWALTTFTAAAFLSSLYACGSSRTSAVETSAVQDAPPHGYPSLDEATCPKAAESGYESPALAFQRYAEAINRRNWCQAARTFEAAARIDLAEANFKGLTLLAGAANPNRVAYQAQLKRFCSTHALGCEDSRWIEQATADMMTGTDIAPKLVEVRRFAADNPALVYSELMQHMSAVDSSALSRFDSTLLDLQISDGKAAAKAKQEDGRLSRINFARTENGWLLSVY